MGYGYHDELDIYMPLVEGYIRKLNQEQREYMKQRLNKLVEGLSKEQNGAL